MIQVQMSLAEVYRNRDDLELTGKFLCYCNSSGQRYRIQLAAPGEGKVGTHYPVLIERQDGQLVRKYLLGSELVQIGCGCMDGG